MKWRGETETQWLERTREWHRHYCWLPTQMRNGKWVWLEWVWAIRHNNLRGGWWFEYSDAVAQPEDYRGPTTPLPPKK